MPFDVPLLRLHPDRGPPPGLIPSRYRSCADVRWEAGRVSVVVSAAAGPDELAVWDSLVADTPGTDVRQLSAWARVRATVGDEAWHILVFHDGRLVAGAQVLHRHVPILGRVGYVPYGPVIASAAPARGDACQAAGEALEVLGRRRLRALLVQPPDGADDVSHELLRRGFRRSDPLVMGKGSVRLNLDHSEAELRRRLSKRLRSWTNRWSDSGVTVRLGDATDVDLLVNLMGHTARHHGFRPLSATYVQTQYEELARNGHAVLFVAEVRGRAAAADLLMGCGGVIKGRLTGFDRSRESRQLTVPGAMRWEEIRWAKAHGFRWFDFGTLKDSTLHGLLASGVRDDPKWPSTDRAKLSFGGGPHSHTAAVELIRPLLVRRSYDLLRHTDGGRWLVDKVHRMLRRGKR